MSAGGSLEVRADVEEWCRSGAEAVL